MNPYPRPHDVLNEWREGWHELGEYIGSSDGFWRRRQRQYALLLAPLGEAEALRVATELCDHDQPRTDTYDELLEDAIGKAFAAFRVAVQQHFLPGELPIRRPELESSPVEGAGLGSLPATPDPWEAL